MIDFNLDPQQMKRSDTFPFLKDLVPLGKGCLTVANFEPAPGFSYSIRYSPEGGFYRVSKVRETIRPLSTQFFRELVQHFSGGGALGFTSDNERLFKTFDEAHIVLTMWFNYDVKDLIKFLKPPEEK